MAQNPLYIDADEEILEVVERLRTATATQLSLIVPHRSKLGQSRLNFQLLHRYAQQLGKQVSVVSAEPAVQQMAAEAGLAVDAAGAPAAQVVAVLPTPNLPPAPTTVAPPMPHSSPDLWVTAAGPGQNPALGAAVGSPPVPAPPPTPTGSAGGPSAAGPYTRQPDRTSESGPIASGLGRPRGAAVRPRPPSGLLPVPLRLSPRLIAIGSGVIGLLVLGLIVAYLPSADITLVTQASSFTQTTNVPLPQAAPITSRQVSDKQQTNGSFAVTGTKVTQAVAATGTVVLSNKNCNLGSLRIPSGTHYYASQIAFVQNADITVPDGKSVSASITATSPGVASNLPPNSITSTDDQPLEALVTVGNCFSFTNTAPTTGGVDQRTDPQISQDDLDKARASLTTKVQALIQTDLARQTKPGEALSNQVAYQAPDFLPDHNLGDLVSSFNSSLSLTGQGSFYQTADVQKAFNDNLVAQAQAQHPDQSLVPGHLAATYQETTASGGALTFQGSATGYLAPQLDEQKIRSKLAGKSIEGARAYLTTLPISQASITQSAFHLPNLPLFSSRITIKYQIDQA